MAGQWAEESSCLYLPRAGIAGNHHHVLYGFLLTLVLGDHSLSLITCKGNALLSSLPSPRLRLQQVCKVFSLRRKGSKTCSSLPKWIQLHVSPDLSKLQDSLSLGRRKRKKGGNLVPEALGRYSSSSIQRALFTLVTAASHAEALREKSARAEAVWRKDPRRESDGLSKPTYFPTSAGQQQVWVWLVLGGCYEVISAFPFSANLASVAQQRGPCKDFAKRPMAKSFKICSGLNKKKCPFKETKTTLGIIVLEPPKV